MATNVRGRTTARSGWNRSPANSARSGQSGWGRTGSTSKSLTRSNAGGKKGTGSWSVPQAYKGCCCDFECKINSFKTLYNQTRGPAKCARPSLATLNTFANWVNKGAIVQTVSNAQIARWARSTQKNFNSRNPTPTSCKSVLWAKFGKNAIKAVARTKTGSFMVATPQTIKGKPFCFPK